MKDVSVDKTKPSSYNYTYTNRSMQEEGKDPISEIRMHFSDATGQEKF